MSKRVKLQDVTVHNWEEVTELSLRDDQDDYVASNSYSLAESKFNPYCVPKAIYAGKRLVGFVMWESLEEDDEPHEYSIYRLMIDQKHQGKGYGKAAMKLAIDAIRKGDRRAERIETCYVPDNEGSRRLYAGLGFKEVGVDDDGEIIAEIELKPSR